MAVEGRTRAQIRPIKQRVEDELLAIPGVTGVDINRQVTKGQPTGELAIVVYVEKKKPANKVPKNQLIPSEIDGIPTDVKEQKKVVPKAALTRVPDRAVPLLDKTNYTTLHGGISIGPCRTIHKEPPEVPEPGEYTQAGTLGMLVRDRVTRDTVALTNLHVVAADSNWAIGERMAQPSLGDGGECPADGFGAIWRAQLTSHIDGAVVSIDDGVPTRASIEEIGLVSGQAAAVVGSEVRKRGRTTNLTYGIVDSVDATLTIDYGDGFGSHTLRNQVRILPDVWSNPHFSESGDSGSVVVDGDGNVVGLLFGGAEDDSDTYANPIQRVLDDLAVDIIVPPLVLTDPVVCDPIVTKAVPCSITTHSVACSIITRPVICEVLTSATGCLAPVTRACPPVSLACVPNQSGWQPTLQAGVGQGGGFLESLYGSTNSGRVDEAFWLGYYSALEAIAQVEERK
jgi:hypothetical protein